MNTKCTEMAEAGQMVFVPDHGYFFVYWKINVDMKMLKALLGIAPGATVKKFCMSVAIIRKGECRLTNVSRTRSLEEWVARLDQRRDSCVTRSLVTQ